MPYMVPSGASTSSELSVNQPHHSYAGPSNANMEPDSSEQEVRTRPIMDAPFQAEERESRITSSDPPELYPKTKSKFKGFIKNLFKLKKSHTPCRPESPNPYFFLEEVDFPQAHPTDSADTLRQKAAFILESYFREPAITRSPETWLDLTQKLAQGIRSSGDNVNRDDLKKVLDSLQNPKSDLYFIATKLLLFPF